MSESVIIAREMGDLVRQLCVALTNVESFTANHPLAKKHVDAAYKVMASLLQRQKEPLIISVSNKCVLFGGMPLEDRNPLVSKFAMRLEDIHAHHLAFDPAITADEFQTFFGVLGKGARYINEHGGLSPLMEAAQITHVKVRKIDYVMVNEGEKVVSKAAAVIEPSTAAQPSAEKDIVQYVMQKVLTRTEEQQWLMQEMKNNPRRVADLFVEGIGLAASRAEMGMSDESAGMGAILKNIQFLGKTLASQAGTAPPEGQEDLEKSVLMLEKEIRQRTARLTSSKVAAGLLSEILGVITSYTDQTRARKITDEFIRGERSLQKTEELLRKLTPTPEKIESFLGRIREHLLQGGMTPDELAQLEANLTKEAKPKAPAKPRKRASDFVTEGITKRLKEVVVDRLQLQEVVTSVSAFVEARARERAGEFRLEAGRLREELTRRDTALQNLPWGVVLWNAEGKVEFFNHAAAQVLGTETGVELSMPLRMHLKGQGFPLADLTVLNPAQLSAPEIRLLRSASVVLKSEPGDVCGVVLANANG